MNNLKMTEQTISSLEVADMVEKQHKNLLRDITKYNEELNQLKIEPVEFFRASIGMGKEKFVLVLMLQRKAVNLSHISLQE